ncbi:hypothetical protein PHLGIDRAFT_14460 [Phlebiopsis gigantea 11061_1 CR5-6]|uniref:Uncharacterized protein n=1 Tax=Phlebiopsis gigantea (strain 11061_1 CR5-6) TaxID=745531 RepID=A0A0C3S8Q9_PHLG1|nr:hypothetical protein PHLGIDRAFT_14460 [Phlebiopsis gigantea 11061_1 CR5-6]
MEATDGRVGASVCTLHARPTHSNEPSGNVEYRSLPRVWSRSQATINRDEEFSDHAVPARETGCARPRENGRRKRPVAELENTALKSSMRWHSTIPNPSQRDVRFAWLHAVDSYPFGRLTGEVRGGVGVSGFNMPHHDPPVASRARSPVRRHKRPGRRYWYRDYFIDHPAYTESDNREAFAGRGKKPDKVKIFCAACFEREINALSGTMDREACVSLRTSDTERVVWDAQDGKAQWIANRPQNCLVHLRDCENQLPDVRQKAENELKDSAKSKSHQRRRTASPSPHGSMLAAQPLTRLHHGRTSSSFGTVGPWPGVEHASRQMDPPLWPEALAPPLSREHVPWDPPAGPSAVAEWGWIPHYSPPDFTPPYNAPPSVDNGVHSNELGSECSSRWGQAVTSVTHPAPLANYMDFEQDYTEWPSHDVDMVPGDHNTPFYSVNPHHPDGSRWEGFDVPPDFDSHAYMGSGYPQ